jgi:hypothetical protein
MRQALLALTALLLAVAPAAAQRRTRAFDVEKVEVGFRSQSPDQPGGLFKSGLWTPIIVTLWANDKGKLSLPVGADGSSRGQLVIKSVDADGGPNFYFVPFTLAQKGHTTVIGYTMPGAARPDLELSLAPADEPGRHVPLPLETPSAIGLEQHLYLSLGSRLPDLQAALADPSANPSEAGEGGLRFAAYETEAARLPDLWFGYDGVDFIILTTDNDSFLKELEGSPARLKALAQWVQRGGRLLVSVSATNQDRISKLLSGPAWQPALPVIVPPNRQARLTSLPSVQNWARLPNKPFPVSSRRPLVVPKLKPGKSAEVLFSEEETGDAILLRLPYGRGNLSFLALSLDKGPFTGWEGRLEFWRALLNVLAPRVQTGARLSPNAITTQGGDAASDLERELDNFDVPAVSFGWVALFILLYVLLVGPLDYLVLKKVFKHLEWTWITLPALIVVVSVAAYFTAHALKDNGLEVNKLDLVDVDQRSDLDDLGRTRSAQVYGTTWFTLLSPQSQSYSIGLEPALASWPGGMRASDVMLTWFGRPEVGLGYGRLRSQALFRHSYGYVRDGSSLRDVAIPIWTSKAFSASWRATLGGLPFTAELHYKPGDVEQRLEGTLTSHLPLALKDVYLLYGNRFYPLADLKAGGRGGRPVAVVLDPSRADSPERWPQRAGLDFSLVGRSPGRPYDPVPILKRILFHEYGGGNNHAYRRLDESWRLRELQARDEHVRDAILIGRVQRAHGPIEELTKSDDPQLPSRLALGEQAGTLTQDTYVRVFLPVRPQ